METSVGVCVRRVAVRAASRPRSQHGNLGHVLERAEAVLDQPAHRHQTSQ